MSSFTLRSLEEIPRAQDNLPDVSHLIASRLQSAEFRTQVQTSWQGRDLVRLSVAEVGSHWFQNVCSLPYVLSSC